MRRTALVPQRSVTVSGTQYNVQLFRYIHIHLTRNIEITFNFLGVFNYLFDCKTRFYVMYIYLSVCVFVYTGCFCVVRASLWLCAQLSSPVYTPMGNLSVCLFYFVMYKVFCDFASLFLNNFGARDRCVFLILCSVNYFHQQHILKKNTINPFIRVLGVFRDISAIAPALRLRSISLCLSHRSHSTRVCSFRPECSICWMRPVCQLLSTITSFLLDNLLKYI